MHLKKALLPNCKMSMLKYPLNCFKFSPTLVVYRLKIFSFVVIYALFNFLFLTATVAPPAVYPAGNSAGNSHASLWDRLDKYSCACFAMKRTYVVQRNHVAPLEKVQYGLSPMVLPGLEPNLMGPWLQQSKSYIVKYKPPNLFTGSPGIVDEFALGVIVEAGPLMSYDMRQRLFDKSTNGKFFKLKLALQRATQEADRERIKQQMRGLRSVDGYCYEDFLAKNTPYSERRRVIYHSQKKFASVESKLFAWQKDCDSSCRSVLATPKNKVMLQLHLEFGVLTVLKERPDRYNEISSEPLHIAITQMPLPFDNDDVVTAKTYTDWAEHFRKHYGPIFAHLSKPSSARDSSIPTIGEIRRRMVQELGHETTWDQLSKQPGITKDVSQIYFPTHIRKYYRTISHPDFPEYNNGPVVALFPLEIVDTRNVIPQRMEGMSSPQIDPKILGRRLLNTEERKVKTWPLNVDEVFQLRVTPVYSFSARLILEERTSTFEPLPMFTGVTIYKPKSHISLLNVYLTMKEHALLRETLRNLVKLWGKDAVRLYQNEIRNGHQEPPVSDLHGSAEREVNPHNGRTSRTSGSTPPTSPISNRLTRPTTRSRADSVSHWIDDQKISYITVTFHGAFYQTCMYTADVENNGATMGSRNGLAFLVRPASARVRRMDGMPKDYTLSRPTYVSLFLPDSGGPLSRVAPQTEVFSKLPLAMKTSSPKAYDMLYEKIFNGLKASNNRKFFEENTCQLDLKDETLPIEFNNNPRSILLSKTKDIQNPGALQLTHLIPELNLLLTKCYGRVLPGTVMLPRKEPNIPKKICSMVKAKQRHEFVQYPLEQ